jgi:pimeloyl-ACP methyl ester carboxylesterase
MNYDIELIRGKIDKPAIVFIHGLGMDKNIWVNPSKSRILGGKLSLKVFLGKKPSSKNFGPCKNIPQKKVIEFSTGEQPEAIETLFNDLRLKGYAVITWSQKKPSGPLDSAVSELEEVIKVALDKTKAGIILIGHSRGGLIGRKYLLRKDRSIRSLITISS